MQSRDNTQPWSNKKGGPCFHTPAIHGGLPLQRRSKAHPGQGIIRICAPPLFIYHIHTHLCSRMASQFDIKKQKESPYSSSGGSFSSFHKARTVLVATS